MEAVLKALNHLLKSRLIENYAIGGAIGASFYIEAMQTEAIQRGRGKDLPRVALFF